MKLCFPVRNNNGADSIIYEHFGSAPGFMLCDSETYDTQLLENNNEHHQHGQCNPVMAIGGHDIDALLVAGIGGNAVMKLNSAGIKVYQARPGTVRDNVDLFKANALPEFSMKNACQGHGHG